MLFLIEHSNKFTDGPVAFGDHLVLLQDDTVFLGQKLPENLVGFDMNTPCILQNDALVMDNIRSGVLAVVVRYVSSPST